MTETILLVVATAVLCGAAASGMRRASVRLGFTDVPNERSLHVQTTPRAGGVGFAFIVPAAVAIGFVLLDIPLTRAHAVLLVSAAGLALVGLADDRWGLSPTARFIAQGAAAGLVIASGVSVRELAIPGRSPIPLGLLGPALTVTWIVFLTNIYNFMDGIDGIAATQAVIAAAALCIVAVTRERADVALAMAVLGAGVAGFLALNWPPARIFMGDVGSTFLGFSFAAWAVFSSSGEGARLPFIAWVAVLSPFLFDGVFTLIRRAVRGERLHQAHRTHLYQRLVTSGWTHRRTTMLYGAMALVSSVATFLRFGPGVIPTGVFAVVVVCAMAAPIVFLRPRSSMAT